MTKKIFKSMFAVSTGVLLVCAVCISLVLYGYFENIIEDELKTEAKMISRGIDIDENYLEDMDYINNRVTLVDSEGNVIFDSRSDAGDMENHADREEIAEAMENGEGYSVRYSDTLATKTIYYAVETADGDILRVSRDQSVVSLLLKGVLLPIVLIMIALIIIVSLVSRAIARKIVTPVNEMDLNDPDAEEPYAELAPFVRKIRKQNKHINMQINEKQRRQNEFTAITENMNEGFLLIDKNVDIISCNKAAIDLLGDGIDYKPGTAYELNRSLGFRKAVEESLKGNNNQQQLISGDRYYQIMANPVEDNEELVGAVIIVMDVTEKEQREQLRREFTSNVSHELKTPLTTIYGVSDMMAEGIVKQSDVKTFGKSIKDESGRLISLINDIIKLSKLDENHDDDEFSRVDLMETAKDVIERLSLMAEGKKVSMYLEGESGIIAGIPSLCTEVIYNLCENAIKYNKEGGSVTVNIRTMREGVELSVEDTGIGIPFEYRDRVFERFFRVDKSHSSNTDGTGLGLSIVKHAVLRMKGSIDIDSMEGAGTKISVRFPR